MKLISTSFRIVTKMYIYSTAKITHHVDCAFFFFFFFFLFVCFFLVVRDNFMILYIQINFLLIKIILAAILNGLIVMRKFSENNGKNVILGHTAFCIVVFQQRRRFTNHPNQPCKSGEKWKSMNESVITLFCLPNISIFRIDTYSSMLTLFSCVIWC